MESSSPTENRVYILELDKLEIGDIILESGSSKFSWWIKKGTDSEYSHVMLYAGLSVIHALTDGVYSGNPQRILVNSQNDLKILRLKDRDDTKINEVIENARTLIGSLYSIPEAIKAPINKGTKVKAKTAAQYCSKLIASVYSNAGIDLVENADYCSPEDINKSQVLIEIRNCLREANISEIEFAKSSNPILENQKSTFKYLKDCRKLFKEKSIGIQSETDVAWALSKHRDLDSKVCEYIRDSQYLEYYNIDEIHSPYRYELPLFLNACKQSTSSINDILIREFNSVSQIIERHIQNYELSKLNYINTGLEYYSLYIELYKNILLSSTKWLLTLHAVSKIIGDTEFEYMSSPLLDSIEKLIN